MNYGVLGKCQKVIIRISELWRPSVEEHQPISG